MSEIKARIVLDDNFSAEIMKPLESVNKFEQAVKGVTENMKTMFNTRVMFQNDEAMNRIIRMKQSMGEIKRNIDIMVEARGRANESINNIKNSVKSLVSKPVDIVMKATDNVTSIIRKITDNIFSLKTLAAGIILGGAGKKAYDLTLGNAGSNEQYLSTLQTVLHDDKKGSEALKWSYNTAAKTPFDSEQVVSGVTQLATSQLDYTKYLMPLGDAAAAMNKPLEQAIFAMSKLKSGQLGMGVDMFRDLGVSNQDWIKAGAKFSKSGEMQGVTPDQAVDMVTGIINSKFGGLMAKQSGTAKGMMSNIGDSISAIGRGLAGIDGNGAIMQGGLFDNFKQQLTVIGPLLSKIQGSSAFSTLQKDIGQLATEGGNKLTAFLKSFDNPETITRYKDSFKQFVADVKAGWDVLKDFAKAVGTIGTTLQPVFSLVATHPGLFLGLFAGFEASKGALSIMNTFRDVKKELPLLITSVKTFGTGFVGVFKTIGAVLMANPIILAITGITAVVAVLYTAWTNDWGGIREKTTKAITVIKEGFDKFKKAVIEFKDNAIKKAKDEFDKLRDALVNLKDNAVKKTNEKFDDFKKTLKDNQTEIKVTASILGTIFGPALLATGTKATIAGLQIVGHFVASIVKTGTMAVINGAKVTASFVVSMVNAGTTAVVNSAKITVSFIASMIKAGASAVVNGIKITTSFVASIAKAGAEAVISGAKITISFIASLVKAAAQASITAATITGQLIVSIASYAIEGWKAVIAIGAQTVALGTNTIALGAQKAVLLATTIATKSATAAQWLFNIALSANPIGLVIIGLTALGVAIYEVVKHWKEVCEWIEKAWNWLTTWNGTKAENKTTTVTTNYENNGSGIYNPITGKKNALGTSYFSGGMSLVGELGPELVELPSGSKVHSNRESKNMMGNSVTIAKLADTIVVREESDIDNIATAIVKKLTLAEINM